MFGWTQTTENNITQQFGARALFSSSIIFFHFFHSSFIYVVVVYGPAALSVNERRAFYTQNPMNTFACVRGTRSRILRRWCVRVCASCERGLLSSHINNTYLHSARAFVFSFVLRCIHSKSLVALNCKYVATRQKQYWSRDHFESLDNQKATVTVCSARVVCSGPRDIHAVVVLFCIQNDVNE